MLSDSLTRGEGCCFLGESSLKSWLGWMTITVNFNYNNTIVEGDKHLVSFLLGTDAVIQAEM